MCAATVPGVSYKSNDAVKFFGVELQSSAVHSEISASGEPPLFLYNLILISDEPVDEPVNLTCAVTRTFVDASDIDITELNPLAASLPSVAPETDVVPVSLSTIQLATAYPIFLSSN